MTPKILLAFAGLPASGKSAVASRLHQALDSVLLDKDQVREFFFQQHVDYTDVQNDLCIDLMYQAAEYLMSSPQPPLVIIDGRSYSKRVQIDALKSTALRSRCRLCIVECICSADTAKTRLAQDQGIHPARDRDYAMYMRSKAAAEPILEPRLTLDTDRWTADECCQQTLNYLAKL